MRLQIDGVFGLHFFFELLVFEFACLSEEVVDHLFEYFFVLFAEVSLVEGPFLFCIGHVFWLEFVVESEHEFICNLKHLWEIVLEFFVIVGEMRIKIDLTKLEELLRPDFRIPRAIQLPKQHKIGYVKHILVLGFGWLEDVVSEQSVD